MPFSHTAIGNTKKMMTKIISLISLCLFLSSNKNFAQETHSNKNLTIEQTDVILDSIISLAKSHSYYSSKVNWEELEREMQSISKKYDSIDRLGKPAEYMFQQLGDYHGMLMFEY